MRSSALHVFRTVVAFLFGFFLLAESFHSNFLRPTVESRTSLVQFLVALFGAGFLLQAFALVKDLKKQNF